jgi:hypothetical protein
MTLFHQSSIVRWECPECGLEQATLLLAHTPRPGSTALCPGVPAERTYVAVDAVLALPQFLAIQQDREGYTQADGWPHADPHLETCIPVRSIEALAKGGPA